MTNNVRETVEFPFLSSLSPFFFHLYFLMPSFCFPISSSHVSLQDVHVPQFPDICPNLKNALWDNGIVSKGNGVSLSLGSSKNKLRMFQKKTAGSNFLAKEWALVDALSTHGSVVYCSINNRLEADAYMSYKKPPPPRNTVKH